jgi:hypothetical protein
MKARKEYLCELCYLAIKKGDQYQWTADFDDIMVDKNGNSKVIPGRSFSRLHSLCMDLIADGEEVPNDLGEARDDILGEIYGYEEVKVLTLQEVLKLPENPKTERDGEWYLESFVPWREFIQQRIKDVE